MSSSINLIDQRRLIGPGGSTVGGEIAFYYTGTSVLAPIYYDPAMAVPAPNPIKVGAGDIVPVIFLDDAITYRRVIKYEDGTYDEVDPLNPLGGSGGDENLGILVGGIIDFAGTTAPDGYLLCAGQDVSRTTYSDLFNVIGTTYGAGNGTSTFTLPDYRGRVGAGKDNMDGNDAGRLSSITGSVLGSTGGSQTVALTVGQMPSHNHGGSTGGAGGHVHDTIGTSAASNGTAEVRATAFGGGNTQLPENYGRATEYAGDHDHPISSQGSGQGHPNVQPTIIVNKIIKYSTEGSISLTALNNLVDSAWDAYEKAKEEADKAELAAQAAILSGAIYASISEGLENTKEGDFFSVAQVDTDLLDLYQNVSGSAVYWNSYPSSTDTARKSELASTAGAGMVGLEQGGTVQQAISWVTPGMFAGDITTAFEAALTFLGVAGGGELFVPAGSYTVLRELKVPSNVTMRGAGRDITIIKADDSLAANQNVITNSLNDRLARTTYNENIHIWDMTVDANWQGRDPTEAQSTQTQGTGIKFSTVRNSSIRRVRAINGLLHCIDIMASTYFDDGNINNTAVGPSLDCVVEDCIAENSQRDDGITTHNSGRLVIDRCQSFRDRATYGEPRLSQHGIEIDEGSFDVTVRDCYTKGWTSGFQAKGHTTTMPAINVLFDHCFAEECAMGFQIEHLDPAAIPVGQVKYARNVTLRNCKASNIRTTAAVSAPFIVYMRGYSGVLIDGFEVDDFGGGVFAIESGMTGLVIRNVLFWGASSRTGEATGLVHGYGTAADGSVTVENVTSHVPQPVPLVRFSSGTTIKNIRNISGTGTDAAVPCVWLSRNSKDTVGSIQQTGYSCDIRANSEVLDLSNFVVLENGLRCVMSGTSSPEGVVEAPLGTIYTMVSGTATQYIKATAPTTSTGWVVVGSQT